MPASAPLRLLYIPVSGSAGSGERRRCEILAARVAQIAPEIEQAIAGPFTSPAPLRSIELPGSPTRHPEAVIAAIDDFLPDWLIFDGNGRRSVLRHARNKGIRIVFIASRPSSRRRAFDPRRMGLLDRIWLIEASPKARTLRWREKLWMKLHRHVSVQAWSTMHLPPDDALAKSRLTTLGWQPDEYLLLCAGGGGQMIGGRAVNDLLFEAGEIASRATGLPALLIGSNGIGTEHVHCVPTITQAELLALAGYARACLIGGGSLLPQCLSVGAYCASAGWQKEQRTRVRELTQNDLVVTADVSPRSMAAALISAAIDPQRREWLSAGLKRAAIVNGIEEAAHALADITRCAITAEIETARAS